MSLFGVLGNPKGVEGDRKVQIGTNGRAKLPRSPCPLTEIPKKSPTSAVRTPYPLHEKPKKSP